MKNGGPAAPAPPERAPLAGVRHVIRRVRSSDTGVVGQGLRYAIAGGTVTCVYLATTLVLADVVAVRFQIALIVGFVASLTVHFTLQRAFVWVHHEEFALPIHHQLVRYLPLAALQYGTTAGATRFLPHVLGLATVIVYLGVAAGWIVANFLVFRHGIFHADRSLAQ